MRIPKAMLDEMIAHAREGAPDEVCGIIAGSNGRGERLYRATNVAENRRERYWMDSRQQLHIMRDIDGCGWELLAIYHSHPHSPARPSKTDKDLAGYPDAVYIIVSLKDGERPEARAFRIDGQRVQEEELLVED